MALTGKLFIGAKEVVGSAGEMQAINPATNELLPTAFSLAGQAEVALACALAAAAFDRYRESTLDVRARFLEDIASNIEALGDELIERAMAETALPRARLEGERARTCNQLRLFAGVVRSGDFLGVRIDPAQPARQPMPRSDLRMRHIALGPVAVFGASNFPLAFSVAGGDTASALAAGCPVVFKAHPAHPGVSELVGRAIQAAVCANELPEGVFSLLLCASNEEGAALVANPYIQAVAFTGSRPGGQALLRIAQSRHQPIPFYGELSAVNPVFLLPGALTERAAELGRQFVTSLTMGSGQFCTNPGLLLAIDGPELDAFVASASEALAGNAAQTMLTEGICHAYEQGVRRLESHNRAETLARGLVGEGPNRCQAGLFATHAIDFRAAPHLQEEIFGACALVVRCRDVVDLLAVAESLEGQLTSTLHLSNEDLSTARHLLPLLERKAGRILVNGWPTGVEVCHAMVHGGPWPATTDVRTTSVGSAAIDRFLRPVCYQDLPAELLPSALQDENPLGVSRLVDGVWQLPARN